MAAALWSIIVGGLFLVMAISGTYLRRLPISTSMLYVGFGFALGPLALNLLRLEPIQQSALLERVTEVAVVVSLFTAGLKLRLLPSDPRWRPALRLAFGAMSLTVAMIASAGFFLLGLSLGAAVLLGAILAPTDPVLASDVQVEHPFDSDRLRFSLTGEAGWNDGTAFPFVMLGLGLLGLHEIGPLGWKWFLLDVLWAVSAGVAVGILFGTFVGRLVVHLRREHREAIGLDEFLALGLIGLSYGVALLCHAYGFLAVFAAGLAMRRVEATHSPAWAAQEMTESDTTVLHHRAAMDPEQAGAYLAHAVLHFNEQLERIGEAAVVVMIGAMLAWQRPPKEALWFLPLLFLIVRPISVELALLGSSVRRDERRLISWFGIRGIGSLYYLMYAIEHGVPEPMATRLVGLTLTAVAASILAHGMSVTPLMARYRRHLETREYPS
jgi:sodium/hydrogen antiporter